MHSTMEQSGMKLSRFRNILKISFAFLVVVGLMAGWFIKRIRDNVDIAPDQAKIIDQKTISGKSLFLVHRIGGFQDKAEILQLYAQRPIFNNQGFPSVEPISSDTYSEEMGYFKEVTIRENSIEIIYTNNKQESTDISKAKLPMK